jgi:amidase
MRDEDFSRQQEIAATLTDDDISDRAAVARGATLLHRAWGNANEMRTKLRYSWHEFLKRFDVSLRRWRRPLLSRTTATPIATSTRSTSTASWRRTRSSYSLRGLPAYLPATAAPTGLTGEGLPVGLQIIGPEGEAPTTIEFARLLAAEIGGLVPPPGYT